MSNRTVWYEVFDLKNPAAEPFMVVRVDASVSRDSGVEGEVIALHWNRAKATAHAELLSMIEGASKCDCDVVCQGHDDCRYRFEVCNDRHH